MSNWKEKFNRLATVENFIYGIVFLLPAYLIKIDFFIPTNLLEVLIIIFLVISFLDKKNWLKIKTFSKKNRKYLISFLILIISLAVSSLIHENTLKGLGIVKSWFVLPFLFAMMAFIVLKKEKKKNIFITLYYSSSILAVLGLIYIVLGRLTYDGRLETIFNSPNYLAMYLIPGFIAGLFLAKKNFWLKSLPLGIILVSLFFTQSYLAWISLGVVICILIGGLRMSYKTVLAGVLAIGIVFIFMAFRLEKMKDIISFNERSSVASRVIIWQSAGKILSENWTFGIGPSNFQEKYLDNQKYYPPYLEWAVPHPHSTYLAFWLGGGLVAIASFVVLLFWWLKEFFIKNKKETIIGIVSLGIIIYFLLHGVADTTYFKNDISVIFWLAFLSLL